MNTKHDFIDIMRGELDACSAIECATLRPPGSLADTWTRPYMRTKEDLFYLMWLAEMFASEELYKRIAAVNDEIDQYWSDLADLGYKVLAKSSHVSERAKNSLKCRLLIAQFPTMKDIVARATGVSALRAKFHLEQQCFRDNKWLVK